MTKMQSGGNEYTEARWLAATELLAAIGKRVAEGTPVDASRDLLDDIIARTKDHTFPEEWATKYALEIRVLKLANLWPWGK